MSEMIEYWKNALVNTRNKGDVTSVINVFTPDDFQKLFVIISFLLLVYLCFEIVLRVKSGSSSYEPITWMLYLKMLPIGHTPRLHRSVTCVTGHILSVKHLISFQCKASYVFLSFDHMLHVILCCTYFISWQCAVYSLLRMRYLLQVVIKLFYRFWEYCYTSTAEQSRPVTKLFVVVVITLCHKPEDSTATHNNRRCYGLSTTKRDVK